MTWLVVQIIWWLIAIHLVEIAVWAVAFYLLIAVIFAYFFLLLVTLVPNAFSQSIVLTDSFGASRLLYFSFATIRRQVKATLLLSIR